jgi:hypothetical protein
MVLGHLIAIQSKEAGIEGCGDHGSPSIGISILREIQTSHTVLHSGKKQPE